MPSSAVALKAAPEKQGNHLLGRDQPWKSCCCPRTHTLCISFATGNCAPGTGESLVVGSSAGSPIPLVAEGRQPKPGLTEPRDMSLSCPRAGECYSSRGLRRTREAVSQVKVLPAAGRDRRGVWGKESMEGLQEPSERHRGASPCRMPSHPPHLSHQQDLSKSSGRSMGGLEECPKPC